MKNEKNPILEFRKAAGSNNTHQDGFFDIQIGARVNDNGVLLIDSDAPNNFHINTLITETREAVDSAENS